MRMGEPSVSKQFRADLAAIHPASFRASLIPSSIFSIDFDNGMVTSMVTDFELLDFSLACDFGMIPSLIA